MKNAPWLPLLRAELDEQSAYLPESGNFRIHLDANEAPPLLSDKARARLAEVASQTAWERYPDPTAARLREAIATYSGVTPSEVLVGVGSDELITILLTALGEAKGRSPRSVVTTTPGFVMYRMSARLRGLPVLEVPLDPSWDIPEKSLLAATQNTHPGILFLASPNNPTGTLFSLHRLRSVIEAAPEWLVVIDEAYIDYAELNQLELLREYPNVVILRTLSKVGFASLRLGWLLGPSGLVRELDKVRLPYNINGLSQKLGQVVLTELAAEIRQTCECVRVERTRLAQALAKIPGVSVTPSQANFIWFRTEVPAEKVFDSLKNQGVLVRSFHGRGGRLAHQLRVTVGTPDEDLEFLDALGRALSEAA